MMEWMSGWMMALPILFLVIVVLVIVLVLKAIRFTGTSSGDSDKALGILRERFARGEIDEQEFEERSQRLGDLE